MRRIAIAATLLLAAPALAGDPAEVAYPRGYRGWQHVKSMVLEPGHPLYEAVGGIHHIYANRAGLAGYGSRRWADGAVLVFDLFDAVEAGNAVSEGPRKAVVVMQRDARRFADTNGWGFQVFDPATRKGKLDARAAASCAACHASQASAGYVFSALRD